jgi:hypothetical protein
MPLNLNEKSKNEISLKLFKLFDIDGDNYINYAEYIVSFWIRCQAPIKEKFTWLFNMFDINKNGSLDYYELKQALSCCFDLNDLDELLEQLNTEKMNYFQKSNSNLTCISTASSISPSTTTNGSCANDDDDEAFYDDNSAFSTRSNFNFIDATASDGSSNHKPQHNKYTVFSKTAKLLDDKLNELIMQLDDALTHNFYQYNKKTSSSSSPITTKIPLSMNRINFKRQDFISLCAKYKLLRKLLVPIDYFYEYDLVD